MKIALALIVKGSDEEAKFLDRLMNGISWFDVDGIFITSTFKKGDKPNKMIDKIGERVKANMSYFEWRDDFSAARNFNFSQVPKEYDFILWCDADDAFYRINRLRKYIEDHPEVDAWTMQYYYERDSSDNPIVVHTKTQVVRNDGCVSWVNRIHEDFKENRGMNVRYIDEIKRIHLTNESHSESAKRRNLEIAKIVAKELPDDPRTYFDLGNAYWGIGDNKKAKTAYLRFLKTSNSDAEKYVIYQRLAHVERALGNRDEAINYLLMCVGMFPEFPDALNQMGYMYGDYGDYDKAEKYLLLGLVTKPQYQRMIVYNPRDYDYNPMKYLASMYFKKSRPDLALPLLEGCLRIYPEDEKLQKLVSEMSIETKRLEKVLDAVKHIATLGDNKEKILYTIEKLPVDLQSHPSICEIRNKYVFKETSTGKDIAYYCGETKFEWNPELFKVRGFGGSEEAVVNLSKEWVKAGYNVTVYNSCGIEPMVADGVTYKPWWMFNVRDKWDHIILWRHPGVAELPLNTKNIYVDLHDVVPEGEFNEKRLKKIKKIMVKTKAHRVLFPNIPDEKFAIIPNGMDFELFNQDVKKDPYLLVNTSSPDRCMDVLPKLFKEVKKQVPQARLKWCYGWNNFDQWYGGDKRMMAWKDGVVKEMKEAGIEDMGRLTQKESAALCLEGSIMAYPSDFYEIDCISIKKAQACHCIPVTTDFAAFEESNIDGIKIHTDRTIKNWALPYQIGFGTKYDKAQKEWVKEVVEILKNKGRIIDNHMLKFAWPIVSKQWTDILK